LKKKEGAFAGCFVLLVEVVAFRGCDFFSLFFAASSGASNCDLRIGVAGRRDVWDWIRSLKGELFSTGKPRALMI
jgi:hypothetical protein